MKSLFHEAVEIIDQFEKIANLDFDQEWWILCYENQGHHFLITFRDEPAAYFNVIINGKVANTHVAYVDDKYRGNHLTEKFYWFLKSRLSIKTIVTSEYRSTDAIAVTNSLFKTKRFKMFWMKDDIKIPFNPDQTGPDNGSVDQFGDPVTFYGVMEPTGWRIVLEAGDYYVNNPKPMIFKLDVRLLENSYDLFSEQ